MSDVFFIVFLLWAMVSFSVICVLAYQVYLLARQYAGPLLKLPVGMWRRDHLSESGLEQRAKVIRMIRLLLIWGGGGFVLLSFLGYFAGIPW